MKLHHIACRTHDFPRLVSFYTQALQLPSVGERPGESVWLSLGDAVLMLERASDNEPTIPPGSMELFALAVDDSGRAAMRTRLEEMGVAIEGETRWTTYFRDPDGRRVAVSSYPLDA